MELTIEQIDIVKNYVKERVNYADLDIEILDHLISDIEQEMDANDISFKDAIYKVHAKWRTNFSPTNHFCFGYNHSSPKIVIDKAKKLFKPYFFTYWSFSIFYIVTVFSFKKTILNDNTIYFLDNILIFSLLSFSLFSFGYIFLKTKNLKIKTTFSFILKTQLYSVLAFILASLVFLASDNNTIISLSLYFAIFSVITSVFSIVFYKKHVHFINKKSNYLLSN